MHEFNGNAWDFWFQLLGVADFDVTSKLSIIYCTILIMFDLFVHLISCSTN